MTRPRAIPNTDVPVFRGEAILLPNPHRVWLPIRKNGWTATYSAIRNCQQPWYPIPEHFLDAYRSVRRVAHWRNPYDRMESAFRFFSQHNHPHTVPDPSAGFSNWVIQISETPDEQRDPHLISQWRSVTQLYTEGPDVVIRWDFSKLATEFIVPEIPHVNKSRGERQHWTDEAEAKFYHSYHKDFEVWYDV